MTQDFQRHNGSPSSSGKAFVIYPAIVTKETSDPFAEEARLEEACGLALAIDLDVTHSEVIRLRSPRPATLIGSGSVETLASMIQAKKPDLVVMDTALTPIQQRNLEKA